MFARMSSKQRSILNQRRRRHVLQRGQLPTRRKTYRHVCVPQLKEPRLLLGPDDGVAVVVSGAVMCVCVCVWWAAAVERAMTGRASGSCREADDGWASN